MRSLWISRAAFAVGIAATIAAAGSPVGEVEGTLVSGPAMRAERAAHTATALADGRVLVAGGFVEQASARGAEIFDPAGERFSPLPPMLTTRHSHTATLLPDGKVLIAGGYGDGTSPIAAAELFDPTTNRFVATGSLVAARASHVAVLLHDGKVLIVGGLGPGWTFLSSAELYDPATGTFSPTGSMGAARESHVAVRLQDGRVLVVGGHNGRRGDLTLLTSAEIYDPASGTFRRTGDMAVRRHKHDGVLLADGRVLITGGSDVRDDRGQYTSTEIFDPSTQRFEPGPAMRLSRYKHAGTGMLLANGRVLLASGAPQAELYDPSTRTFTLVEGAPRMAGQFAAVASLPSGGALITGGYGNGGGPRPSTWLFRL